MALQEMHVDPVPNGVVALYSGRRDRRRRTVAPLPADLDAFVGRDREVAAVVALLGESRLVTLTGPPGVGKTRLGLHAARQASRSGAWRDGPALVELGEVARGDADQLGVRLLSAVGLADNRETSWADRLVEYLRDRSMLLILDNCEHLLDALRPMLRTLLRAAPGVSVLATSRAWLGVPGEHVHQVPPMACGCTDETTPEAVELLVRRAAAAGATVDPDDPRASRLCAMLAGNPLMIELTAARLRMLSLDQALADLARPLELLRGDTHATPAHHSSLTATIEWSYGLLPAPARLVWAVVAELRGTFWAACARSRAPLGLTDDQVTEALDLLVRHSIVQRIAPLPGETEPRLRMSEPVQEFGRQVDPVTVTREEIRRAHAHYYADRARRAAQSWYGPDEVEWLKTVGRCWPDFEAALDFLLTQDDPADRALGQALAVDVCRSRAHMYGGQPGEIGIGVSTGRRMLARARQAQTGPPTATTVTALALEAWCACLQGATDAAHALITDAKAAADALGDWPPALHFVVGGGMALAADPTVWAQSVAMLDKAAIAASERGAHGDAMVAALFGAIGDAFHGDETSIRRAAGLVDAVQTAGAPWALSWALWALALAEYQHGDINRAATVLGRALTIHDGLGDTTGITWSVWLAAVISATRGRHAEARALFEAAEGLQHQTWLEIGALIPFQRVEQAARKPGAERLADTRPLDGLAEDGDAHAVVPLALAALAPRCRAQNPGGLTDRELEVVAMVAEGATNPEIACALTLSTRTVETHISRALRKIGVPTRVALANWHRTLPH